MTPRDFLRHYEFDERIIRGGFYPDAPLDVEEGETVGVVMMNLGGPDSLGDVEPFLYNLFMDPAIVDIPLGDTLRHWLAKSIAYFRAKKVASDYEKIGGGSPINRLTREQARGLQQHLNDVYGRPSGVEFRTYIAMRYWHPFSQEAAQQMKDDGVDRVVLLPLYPHWSKTTSGSSIAYWHALEETGEIPSWPTTSVYEYAANPKYVQAVSERVDEALQRFPSSVREDAHLLFSAHGTPLYEMTDRGDPYCCLVHSTVEQVMRQRAGSRPFHVAFQSKVGLSEWLTPATTDVIADLADDGARAVLVIPIAFVTDHIETSYELDIEVREEAERAGIDHFEVTSGLNSHPLLLEALGEATISQLQLPVDANQLRFGGDGVGDTYPLCARKERPRYDAEERDVRCPNCQCVAEACTWEVSSDVPTAEIRSADQTHPECDQ